MSVAQGVQAAQALLGECARPKRDYRTAALLALGTTLPHLSADALAQLEALAALRPVAEALIAAPTSSLAPVAGEDEAKSSKPSSSAAAAAAASSSSSSSSDEASAAAKAEAALTITALDCLSQVWSAPLPVAQRRAHAGWLAQRLQAGLAQPWNIRLAAINALASLLQHLPLKDGQQTTTAAGAEFDARAMLSGIVDALAACLADAKYSSVRLAAVKAITALLERHSQPVGTSLSDSASS